MWKVAFDSGGYSVQPVAAAKSPVVPRTTSEVIAKAREATSIQNANTPAFGKASSSVLISAGSVRQPRPFTSVGISI